MSRTLLEIALFLSPFMLYALYLFATQRDAREKEHWRLQVLIICAIGGCVLVIASLLYFAHFGGVGPGNTYIPAHMEDGKLVPGHFK
ncbi:MAG TPA: DUF6111 family protein [Xanthobacteraceae bacterium]|jgi:hypothetical protein|nr:DUF6111 family protein [Xanthobacteraceae bacterium]